MAYSGNTKSTGLDTLDNTTLAVGDLAIVGDISDSGRAKGITWTNIKAFLKTYFDTLYPSGSGTSTGTNTGDQTTVSGNAGTATALQTARNIAGVSFNGTANIAIASTNLSDTASIALLTSTQTFTNKRVTKRTGNTTSSATPTINTDNVDFYSITALAAAITSFTTNLSGTPTEAQTLWIAITDNGSARAITWGASFEASGNVALPTTTVISTRLDVGFVWNTVTSKWRCIATA